MKTIWRRDSPAASRYLSKLSWDPKVNFPAIWTILKLWLSGIRRSSLLESWSEMMLWHLCRLLFIPISISAYNNIDSSLTHTNTHTHTHPSTHTNTQTRTQIQYHKFDKTSFLFSPYFIHTYSVPFSFSNSLSLSLSHPHTHTNRRTYTRTHTHTPIHTHAHIHSIML